MKYLIDTHTHTIASGHAYNTIDEMTRKAAQIGLPAIAFTEHTPKMPGSCGKLYFSNFKVLPREKFGVRRLFGCEANIMDYDGTLDMPDTLLEKMDIVIASFHIPCICPGTKEQNTQALVQVLENPLVDIIGHPDDSRYPVDFEQAQRAAEQEAAQRQRAAVSEEVSLNTQQLPPMEDHLSDMNPLEAISSAKLASAVQQEKVYTGMGEGTEIDEEKKLSGELAKIFRKYREMPGLESQLAAYFESLEQEMAISTSQIGNIIISGNSSSDKSDLARAIVRAVNYLYPEHTRKIAKTTGDSINNRGLAKAMNKLKGTALIVEGAGAIQPKRMSEMLECLEQDTERMIVILEDSDAEMNVLLNFNPEMTQKFNHRIVLKQYTVNELVEMARKFARKRQYEVSDDALLELYLKIDKLRNNVDNIRMDDIKEIINHAIVKAEKRGSKRFFGGLKRKRGENGDVTILVEADFKD